MKPKPIFQFMPGPRPAFAFRLMSVLVGFICAVTPASLRAEEKTELLPQAEQQIENTDERNVVNIAIENDLFGGGTDRFYTSGIRLSWLNLNSKIPRLVKSVADRTPLFKRDERTSVMFSLGQNIYTPEDIDVRAHQDDDRPWAAFLYGSAALTTIEDNHVDELELTLGVVGPEALGEQTQKFIHRHISSSKIPKGWKNQLNFEPAIILLAQRRWPGAKVKKMGPLYLRAVPHVNFSLGNIYTYAGTGLTFALTSYENRFQDTPGRVQPAIPGSGFFERPEKGWSWQLFAGFEGRAVARNIFLDGNTFRDSHSVDKKNFVGDATAGIAFTWDRYRLSYSINTRTREFDGQDDNSIFGSINLSTRF